MDGRGRDCGDCVREVSEELESSHKINIDTIAATFHACKHLIQCWLVITDLKEAS